MNRTLCMALLVFCALIPMAASAGTVIEFEMYAYDPTMDSGKGTMYIDEEFARVESGEGEKNQVIIVRLDEPVMWNVVPTNWAYQVLTPEKAKKVKSKILERLEQTEERLRTMPRAERERVEKQYGGQIEMMRQMTEDRDYKKMSYKKVEGGIEIREYTCDKYQLFYKDEFDEVEYWVADWGQIDAKPEDFSVCARVEEEFGVFGGNFSLLANMWRGDVENPVDGFPVRFLYYADGSKSMRVDVMSIRQEDLDPALFDLPKDFDEEPFMGIDL